MAKSSVPNSIGGKPPKPSLDHWLGQHQHVADGMSTDPRSEEPKCGPIKGPRYQER